MDQTEPQATSEPARHAIKVQDLRTDSESAVLIYVVVIVALCETAKPNGRI